MAQRYPFFLLSSCVTALLAGCTIPTARAPQQGGAALARLPVAGEESSELRLHYGIPILQKSLFWDGNGEEDDAGLRARHFWHLTDYLALGAGLTAVTYFQPGTDAFGLEGEAIGRIYFYRGDDFGAFAEVTGGWMQSTRPIPSGGTEWNMTFSFGSGVEVPLEEGLDLLFGTTYHHVSNALGPQHFRNPSQNEAQIWAGLGFRF